MVMVSPLVDVAELGPPHSWPVLASTATVWASSVLKMSLPSAEGGAAVDDVAAGDALRGSATAAGWYVHFGGPPGLRQVERMEHRWGTA